MSRREVAECHKNYGNVGLAAILGLLDMDRTFVRAKGTSVWDTEGREYLDFLGGFGSLNVGHNHPAVLAALDLVREMPNFLQSSLGVLAGALAHNLAQIAPGNLKRSFLCNSGCEAVEGALKLARAATGKKEIIYCENSFHGKSFG
ncbi:MAG: aminotransferase class III-fold pyridoxal phosphate-dependent enzyme, partial [Desulfotomaculales bacterium]